MTTEQNKLREAWLTILSILKETGYDYMYESEILLVSQAIRKAIGLD